jgi:hypothetical protein
MWNYLFNTAKHPARNGASAALSRRVMKTRAIAARYDDPRYRGAL